MNNYPTIGQIYRDSEAFFIAEKFNHIEETIIYISRDDKEIINIKTKLKWLLPKTELLVYRSRDQIPYDTVSPSKEIQSERINTLYNLLKKELMTN